MPKAVEAKRRGRPPATGLSRRTLILSVAADLFRERGYHAVPIDAIGDAAGVTGPAIYRHFDSKSDILLALLSGVTEHLHEAAAEAVKDAAPADALTQLIRAHVGFALEERVLLAIYVQERYTLPADQTRPLRRIQHEYLSCWDRVVASLRPDLTAAEVALNVRSVVEMIHSIVFYNHPIEPERVALLLYDLAVQALAPCGAGGAAGAPLPISPADC
jgi:AcrR family transcriptional regulator